MFTLKRRHYLASRHTSTHNGEITEDNVYLLHCKVSMGMSV